MKNWFKKYWPWLAALIWLAGYELYAVFATSTPTLSRLVWDAPLYIVWIVVPLVIILLIHFFVKRR